MYQGVCLRPESKLASNSLVRRYNGDNNIRRMRVIQYYTPRRDSNYLFWRFLILICEWHCYLHSSVGRCIHYYDSIIQTVGLCVAATTQQANRQWHWRICQLPTESNLDKTSLVNNTTDTPLATHVIIVVND